MPYLAGMKTREEMAALCALNKIFGNHPKLGLSLLESVSDPAGLFRRSQSIPTHPELEKELSAASLDWGFKELEKLDAGGFRFIGITSDDYPSALREIPDPPLGIYVNGCSPPAEIFSLRPMIAVVGTRDLSPYGRSWCQKLVGEMVRCEVQPCIVSGLAFGADAVAHRTALECGLPTIGVMATGIDRIYPYQHQELAVRMVGTPGCALVTDYPLGTAPVAWNFIRRNRIIAALARAVIVVESKSKGGSLMTAKYAVEYNRDVFAVPGRLDDVRSSGCNSLIREQMASLILSPETLVSDLGLVPRRRETSVGPGGSFRGGGNGFRSGADEDGGCGGFSGGPGGGANKGGGSSGFGGGPGGGANKGGGSSGFGGGPGGVADLLRKRFGPDSPLTAVCLAIRSHPGITPDSLLPIVNNGTFRSLTISDLFQAISLLESDGIITTDVLGRCYVKTPFA